MLREERGGVHGNLWRPKGRRRRRSVGSHSVELLRLCVHEEGGADGEFPRPHRRQRIHCLARRHRMLLMIPSLLPKRSGNPELVTSPQRAEGDAPPVFSKRRIFSERVS